MNVSNMGEESESNNSPKVIRHTEFVELKIPTNLFVGYIIIYFIRN